MVKKVFSMQKKRFFESVSDIIRKNGIKSKNIEAVRNETYKFAEEILKLNILRGGC